MITRIEQSKDRVLITYETKSQVWFEFMTLKNARNLSLALSHAIENATAYVRLQTVIAKDR